MKALRKNNVLQMEQIETPRSSPNEILIKVAMAGICRTDQYVGDGTIAVQEPLTIGHEFCGFISEDKSGFVKGDLVTVNPLMNDLSFIGINHQGCFAEYISVPLANVFKINTDNLKLAAYIEPISASLAPLKADLEGLIHVYGTNRIAKLTAKILNLAGYEVSLIIPGTLPHNSCQTIVETMMDEQSIDEITNLLKPEGKLILKSRFPNKIPVNLYNFVKKDITIKSCYYYDFQKTIDFALKYEDFFNELFGPEFSLEKFDDAFLENLKAEKKVFFKI
jgi:D-arabinose 1-dehydrogenase-like Zn-dependent alcohol dehydrogenase